MIRWINGEIHAVWKTFTEEVLSSYFKATSQERPVLLWKPWEHTHCLYKSGKSHRLWFQVIVQFYWMVPSSSCTVKLASFILKYIHQAKIQGWGTVLSPLCKSAWSSHLAYPFRLRPWRTGSLSLNLKSSGFFWLLIGLNQWVAYGDEITLVNTERQLVPQELFGRRLIGRHVVSRLCLGVSMFLSLTKRKFTDFMTNDFSPLAMLYLCEDVLGFISHWVILLKPHIMKEFRVS